MSVQRDFDLGPDSARAVRRFVQEVLPTTPELDDIVLSASELAANVVRHAGTSFTVRLVSDDETVRIEVSDGSSIVPAIEDLTASQRGLRIIDAVSKRWGVDAGDGGKTVWAEFDVSQRK